MNKDLERPFFNESTAQLAERVDAAMHWHNTLHTIYVELSHRDRPAAVKLRADLAKFHATFEGYFPWPTADATPSKGGSATQPDFEHKQGVLGFMGYKVGLTGAPKGQRRALLDDAFLDVIPSINSRDYIAEWGKPKAATRLKKIASSLAEFAKYVALPM